MSTFTSRGWRGNGLPQNNILPKMKLAQIGSCRKGSRCFSVALRADESAWTTRRSTGFCH
jgi:hypothetical protein